MSTTILRPDWTPQQVKTFAGYEESIGARPSSDSALYDHWCEKAKRVARERRNEGVAEA